MVKSDAMNAMIEDWVEKYADKLYSRAFYRTSHKETAEDLVQETFMAAFKGIDNFKKNSSPKTWLFSILNHKIIDHFRKSYRSQETSVDDLIDTIFDSHGTWRIRESPISWNDQEGSLLDNTEFSKILSDCLGKLPDKGHAAIHLKYLEEKKVK